MRIVSRMGRKSGTPLAASNAAMWSKKARLIVPDIGSSPGSFPLLFDETSTVLRSPANGGVYNGGDLEFVRTVGSAQWNWGSLHYDEPSGRLVAFVRAVPLSSQKTELTAYVGQNGVNNSDLSAAWTDGLAAWKPATGADMTSGGHSLTPTDVTADATDPWVGVFNGASSRLDLSDASWLSGQSAFSLELLLKADNTTTEMRIVDQGPADMGVRTHGLQVRRAVNGAYGGGSNVYKFVLMVGSWSVQIESSEGLWTTGWQHLLFTWASGELPKLYVNGYADTPTFVGRTNVSGTDTPESGAPVSGTTSMPSGSLRVGGSLTGIDWFDGSIGLLAVYPLRFSSAQALLIAQNRLEPRRGYGISAWVSSTAQNAPVVAVPSFVDQDTSVTAPHTVDADDPDDTPSLSVVSFSGTVTGASISGSDVQVTTGASQGPGEVIWRATAGSDTSDGHLVVRTISPVPPPPTTLLQYKGQYVGGTPCQAQSLRPHYVGIKGTTGTSGRARVAMRFRAPKSGKLDAIAFEIRANRPNQSSDSCSGGYVSSWTDSCTGETFTAASARYCSGGGEYSVGTGGTLRASLHPCKNTSDPDSDNWVPDMTQELAVTAKNGGLTRTLVDEFLDDEPFDWWPFLTPVDVVEGQLYTVVLHHDCVRGSPTGKVSEKVSANTNLLRGSDPARRGGPVFGRDWQGLWDPQGDDNWRPYKANSSEDTQNMLIIRYDDGDAYGPPTKCGQSDSRASIGGSTRGRMRFTIPSDYPTLTCDKAWAMLFKMKSGAGDCVLEVKRSDGTLLATATFPAASFPVGIPKDGDPLDWGGVEVALSQNVSLSPGSTYYFEFSCATYGDWKLQAHNQDLTLGLQAPGVRLVNILPDWKVEISTNGGSTWSAWPGYGEAFPVVLRVASTS